MIAGPVCMFSFPSVLWHCWLGIRKSIQAIKIEWWGVGVVICLEQGADCLHMVQLMPLHPKTPSSLASFKFRLVLPFWYQLTQVVLEKRPLNGCSVVGWLGSRVVSGLDSRAEGPGFKSQPRRCRVTVLGKLFTPIVSLFTKQQNW